uniref:Uncharacterized protein n=1 Tax=Arundo donax TaxID=35708 RepID=A0A0A9DCS2_ARUDO
MPTMMIAKKRSKHYMQHLCAWSVPDGRCSVESTQF